MTLNEMIKKYIDDDEKIKAFIKDMKDNKIFTANEENLDIRYAKLKEQFDLKDKEHQESSKLIEELKNSMQGNEDMQAKIGEYEAQLAALQAENDALKLDNAIKVELLSQKAKASDIDYLMFKIKKNETIMLDDKGNLKGLEVDKLKTTYPSNFEESSKMEVDVNKLPDIKKKGNEVTKEQFNKMGYRERNKLANDNPELYSELNK